jgi:HK97 family phage major capsid protein
MSTTRTLDDRIREVSEQITTRRSDARTAWSEFESLRSALATAELDDNDALDRADASCRVYDDIVQEIDNLEGSRDRLWALTQERGRTEPGSPARDRNERLKDAAATVLGQGVTFGSRIANGDLYKHASEQGIWNRNLGSKVGEVQLGEMMSRDEFFALVTGGSDTSGGALVVPDRQAGLHIAPDQPLLITDLITVGRTDSDSVEFVRVTSFTNNAAPVPEATNVSGASGTKPQSDLALEKVAEPVRTLAHWIAATRRALADAGQLRSLIDGRLRMGLQQVLETQLIVGDGTGENLLGLMNQTGVQTQAVGADSLVDALHRALTKVRLKWYMPTGIALNAEDWQDIRLDKNDNGDYYFGPPSMAGQPTIWGLPAAVGTQFTAGNPIVGDFRQAELWLREGVQVLASDSHADFFIRNIIALLAEFRVAFGVPEPEAFCEVTTGP